jgi:hypothetical protein
LNPKDVNIDKLKADLKGVTNAVDGLVSVMEQLSSIKPSKEMAEDLAKGFKDNNIVQSVADVKDRAGKVANKINSMKL